MSITISTIAIKDKDAGHVFNVDPYYSSCGDLIGFYFHPMRKSYVPSTGEVTAWVEEILAAYYADIPATIEVGIDMTHYRIDNLIALVSYLEEAYTFSKQFTVRLYGSLEFIEYRDLGE